MFSKILVGVCGSAVIGVGGFLFWDHENCPSRQGCKSGGCPTALVAPSCFQVTSQPADDGTEHLTVAPREVSSAEVLTVMPR